MSKLNIIKRAYWSIHRRYRENLERRRLLLSRKDPPEARRRCDLVVVFAVSDGEWLGIEDLLDSLKTYLGCDYEVVVADDATTDGTYERLLGGRCWVIRNPEKLYLSGLDATIRRGFCHALRLFDSPLYLKIDPDALLIGRGLPALMNAEFRRNPQIGLLGTYHYDWNGQPRDFGYWRERMIKVRKELGAPLRAALKNGYTIGDGVQGGAYCLSRECLEAIHAKGWLLGWQPPHSPDRRVAEDHVTTMLTYAAGYKVAEFGGPEQPFGLWYDGPPMLPGELLAQGRLVTHAIKYDDPRSLAYRDFFRQLRKAERAQRAAFPPLEHIVLEAMPTISVVMACWNAAPFVERAIRSVLEQTLTDLELIAVDDGSTDQTADLVAGIRDPRLRLYQQQRHRGVSAARNTGISLAAGDYVAFLDADDTWDPKCLEILFGALQANPGAALAYCGWQNLGLPGKRGAPYVPPDYEGPDKIEALLAACPWPIHAALTRRWAIKEAGGFDEQLPNAEDYLLWLRVASRYPVVRVPEVLAQYHHHEDQASRNRAATAAFQWLAQQYFLKEQPEVAFRLGRRRVRELVHGELLRRGYVCYWERDLPAARRIFRKVMRTGFGSLTDWKYMLPALLPLSVHRLLIRMLERPRQDTA